MTSKRYAPPDTLRVTANALGEAKRNSYTCMHIYPGSKILDVGCGPGADTIPLAIDAF